MYTAVYLPSDDIRGTRSGFLTEDDAWAYIYSNMCKACSDSLLNDAVPFTPCDAEWDVMRTKDWEELCK
jgi:hypothetical protein